MMLIDIFISEMYYNVDMTSLHHRERSDRLRKIKLKEDVFIPEIGLGTWKMDNQDSAKQSILTALQIGYRHIDTAMSYGNEESVGQAIKESGIPRSEIFITTKLSNDFRGKTETLHAFDKSLQRLQTDYIDLFLIHWPAPKQYRDRYIELNNETYAAMEELYSLGKIKALGVSNFLVHHLEELSIKVPISVNQIEFHPYYADWKTIDYCHSHNITVEAYSPLGRGQILHDPVILKMAMKYQKSLAQICIRYALQNNIIPLPKSQTKKRIEENINVFDFEISKEDMQILKSLSKVDGKIGSHPDYADF